MSGPTLEGRLVRRVRSRILRFAAGVTGILLAVHIVRFIGAWILGLKTPCSVTLDDTGLVMDSRTYLTGKLIRSRTVRVPTWKVGVISREQRFRYAHILVGLLFFLVGLGLGFAFIVEWAWTQFGLYLLMGLGAIVLGVALDVATLYLVPVVRKRSAVLFFTDMGILVVEDVLDSNAEQFLEHATTWIQQSMKPDPAAVAEKPLPDQPPEEST